MLKRTKTISIICSITVGIICVLGMLMAMVVFGVIRLNRVEITVNTGDFEARYDGKPISNHTWYISEGQLRNGHTIEVSFTGEQTAVGESANTVEVVIYDELGTDVTSDYQITFVLGQLEVNPRTLQIILPEDIDTSRGGVLSPGEYIISPECDGLASGHSLRVYLPGGQEAYAFPTVTVQDKNGEDVTQNYQIAVSGIVGGGVLVSGNGPIVELEGGGALGGGANFNDSLILFVVYADEDGAIYLKTESFGDYDGKGWATAEQYSELIDGKYSATYLTYDALKNTDTVHEIKIKSMLGMYALPYYLSNEHSIHEIQTSDVISKGDASDVYTVSYVSGADKKQNVSKAYASFEKDYRSFVYNNYLGIDGETLDYMNRVIAKEGIRYDKNDVFSTIEAVAEYIRGCAEYNRDYDPSLDNEKNIVVAFMEEYKEGLCRHYASAATLMFRALGIPARYTTGVLAEGVSETWVEVPATQAHAWVEVYIDGMGWVMVEVTASDPNVIYGPGSTSGNVSHVKKYTVRPKTVLKKYDGTVLESVNEVTGLDDLIAKGYTYKAVVEGSRTEIGITESQIVSLAVYDMMGNDVTDTLNIIIKTGKVHVYDRMLTFESESVKKVYDGELPPLGVLTDGTLAEGHTYTVKSMATPNVGKSKNDFDVKVRDSEGNDVTDHYYIVRNRGSVEITHAEITLKAGDAEKQYDGSALTCNEIEVVSGELVSGQEISFYVVTGSQTAVGRSENSIEYVSISDKDGNDVTKNYTIKYENGRLKVTYS